MHAPLLFINKYQCLIKVYFNFVGAWNARPYKVKLFWQISPIATLRRNDSEQRFALLYAKSANAEDSSLRNDSLRPLI